MPMISQSLPDRDVRIVDAKHFDGPDSLAAILGFLGADTQGSPAAAAYAAGEPGWPERLDDAA
jgi:hypothetical protein